MNSATHKHKIEINWPAVLAYIVLPTLGISAWTGIIYLVRLALRPQ